MNKCNALKFFFQIWSFTHEGVSLITIPEAQPTKVKEADDFIKRYNSILCSYQRNKYQYLGEDDEDQMYKIKVPFNVTKLNMYFQRLMEICAYSNYFCCFVKDLK